MQLIHTVTTQRFDPKAADFKHPRGQIVRRTVLADTESVKVDDVEVDRDDDSTFTVPEEVGQHLLDHVPGWQVYLGVLPGEDEDSLVERQAQRIAELEAQLAKPKAPAKPKAS